MDLGRARSVSLRTVQAVPDTIMPAGHDAFQTHFTERLRCDYYYYRLRPP